MSFVSQKTNNLKKFFCLECDTLLNEGASKLINTSQTLCNDCLKKVSKEEQEKLEKKESHQEVCECLKLIEKTVRVTRNPKPKSKQYDQTKLCNICELTNQIEIKKAEIYCLNDEMMFCSNCFDQQHQTIVSKTHKTKTIQQWIKENDTLQTEQNLEDEYFCSKHKFVEPIFCIDDEVMFCSGCLINEHSNHRIEGIEKRANYEKTKINLETNINSLLERVKEYVKIEEDLTNLIQILQETINESNQIIKESKKSTVMLREAAELWGQMENEIDIKEWCKKDFVEKVKTQIENVGEKWKERERDMKTKTKEMIERLNENVADYYYEVYPDSELKRDKIKRNDKGHHEICQIEPWNDSSLITNKEQSKFLNKILKEIGFQKPIKVSKIFQASKHSFSSEQFHIHCDNKSKTILIVKSLNGNLFGGYSNIKWHKNEWKIEYSKDETKKTHLFNINLKEKYFLKNSEYAIGGNLNWGPNFGGALYLTDKCNLNNDSYSNPNGSYLIPSEICLAGSRNFTVIEYEVWSVDSELLETTTTTSTTSSTTSSTSSTTSSTTSTSSDGTTTITTSI